MLHDLVGFCFGSREPLMPRRGVEARFDEHHVVLANREKEHVGGVLKVRQE